MTAVPLISLASGVLPEHQAETVGRAAAAAELSLSPAHLASLGRPPR